VGKIRCNQLVGNRSGIKCTIQHNKVHYPTQYSALSNTIKCTIQHNCKFVSVLILKVRATGIYFFGHTRGDPKRLIRSGPRTSLRTDMVSGNFLSLSLSISFVYFFNSFILFGLIFQLSISTLQFNSPFQLSMPRS
jgi:hypothetical protein